MTTTEKTCATCNHSRGDVPVMCTLHTRDGAPRLAVPLRAEAGPCGPAGAGWAPRGVPPPLPVSATVIVFPRAHRVSA